MFKELLDDIEATNVQRYGDAHPGSNAVMTNARPKDAEQAFQKLLAPYLKNGQIQVIPHHIPIEVTTADQGTRVTAVTFRSTKNNEDRLTVTARMTIDASDWGDVIQLCGADYDFGPDLQDKYSEPRAPTSRDKYPITDMNPITYCMVLEETDEEHVIPKPAHYDERRYFNTTRLTKAEHDALPWPEAPVPAFANVSDVYASRRIVDSYGLKNVRGPDSILLCWFVQDYPVDVLPQHVIDELEKNSSGASKKNIVEMTHEQRQIIFDDAKSHSLGMLHHLQTTVHERMPDKRHSFRRFKLSDEFGTPDHLPFKPYVRESLRLKAMYMMRQQDTTPVARVTETCGRVMYHDGVAAWQFEYDFHMTGRTFLPGERTGTAWQSYFKKGRTWGPPYAGLCLFPLRSLIPEKTDGLLGGQKNLGYSSIISAAVRLHDQCVAIGQASGAAAAVSLLNNDAPVRKIPFDRTLLQQLREGLCSERGPGLPVALWPFRDLRVDHPAYSAINLLAVSRMLPLTGDEVEFHPDEPATQEWQAAVRQATTLIKQNVSDLTTNGQPQTRAEFAIAWWNLVRRLPDVPYQRLSAIDADGDNIPDREDSLPFDPQNSSLPQTAVTPQ